MTPLLEDGMEVLVDPRAPCRPGDVVVALHAFKQGLHLVKRLERYEPDGRARLLGLDPAGSTDSRTLGAFRPELLRGRVSSALSPRGGS